MDFQLVSNLVSIEFDQTTGWVKAKRATGEAFLIEPRDLLTLMTWGQGNTSALVASQQVIDQEESFSGSSIRGSARPVRLVPSIPTEPGSEPKAPGLKLKRRKPLPLPIIQISQALPCLLSCKTMTMIALLDFNAGPHDPGLLYPFCRDHLQHVLSLRDVTGGLSLRMIVERLIQHDPS